MPGILLTVVSLALAGPPAKAPYVDLLERGERLTKSPQPEIQLRGAKLKTKAYKLAPDHVETCAGMAHAYFIRSFFEKNRKKAASLARRGAKMGERMTKRWPKRAEGYYWVSVNTGLLAKYTGIVEAFSQGMAGTIEKNALKALELDRTIYDGAVPRLLGRYFYLVPWPIRDNARSLKLLREAKTMDPDNPNGLKFLADTLLRTGEEKEARALYARCSQLKGPDPSAARLCKAGLERM